MSELDVNSYGRPTNPDEYGYRTGCPPPAEVAEVLRSTATDVQTALADGPALVKTGLELTTEKVQEHLDLLRGAVMIAYPAYHRLPAFDPARIELEDKGEPDGHSDLQDVLLADDTVMWWAGKMMEGAKTLADHVGANEKTKVVVKLQPKAAGAPVRESRIDEATHKTMLSYYYKKQEEAKKLAQDDDDSYLQVFMRTHLLTATPT